MVDAPRGITENTNRKHNVLLHAISGNGIHDKSGNDEKVSEQIRVPDR